MLKEVTRIFISLWFNVLESIGLRKKPSRLDDAQWEVLPYSFKVDWYEDGTPKAAHFHPYPFRRVPLCDACREKYFS